MKHLDAYKEQLAKDGHLRIYAATGTTSPPSDAQIIESLGRTLCPECSGDDDIIDRCRTCKGIGSLKIT